MCISERLLGVLMLNWEQTLKTAPIGRFGGQSSDGPVQGQPQLMY